MQAYSGALKSKKSLFPHIPVGGGGGGTVVTHDSISTNSGLVVDHRAPNREDMGSNSTGAELCP